MLERMLDSQAARPQPRQDRPPTLTGAVLGQENRPATNPAANTEQAQKIPGPLKKAWQRITKQGINAPKGTEGSRDALALIALSQDTKKKVEKAMADPEQGRHVAEKHQSKLTQYLDRLRNSKKPSDVALSYDFEIATLKAELKQAEAENLQLIAMTDDEVQALEPKVKVERTKRLAELKKKIGEVTATKEVVPGELQKNINLLQEQRNGENSIAKGQPNVIEAFAKKIGVNDATAATNPLGEIIEKWHVMNINQKSGEYLESIKDKVSTEELKGVETIMRVMRGEMSMNEKALKVATKGSVFMGLFFLLFMYMGKKTTESSGGGH